MAWSYTKTMVGTRAGYESYRCNRPTGTETEEYHEHRNVILNGIKSKVFFDCNRGLRGEFLDEDENDYRKALVHPIQSGTVGARYYNGVCRAVTRKDPISQSRRGIYRRGIATTLSSALADMR